MTYSQLFEGKLKVALPDLVSYTMSFITHTLRKLIRSLSISFNLFNITFSWFGIPMGIISESLHEPQIY